MEDRDRNAANMGLTVLNYLNTNNSIWSAVPAIVTAVGTHSANMAAIDTKATKTQEKTEGVTEDKASVRDLLEEEAFQMSEILAAFGDATGNLTLVGDVEVTRTKLDRMSDQDLETKSHLIHQRATEHFGEIKSDYGVTQDRLDAFDALATEFGEERAKPRAKTAELKGARGGLSGQVKAMKSHLRRQMDRLMTRFRTSHPDFYAGYLSARVIVDLKAKQPDDPTPPTP